MPTFDADTHADEVLKALGSHATGKTYLITGASESGIGAATALALATAKPKKFILASRDESKVAPVIEQIKNINPAIEVEFVHCELLDNSSIRKAVEQIKASNNKIDCLINNAGVMAPRNYTTSKDGVESQFAANYLGHFLLTNLLMPLIVAAGEGAVIISVGSLGYQLGEPNVDDINFQDGKNYKPWPAYGASKTANLLVTVALAKRLASKKILVLAVHPGVVMESKLLPNSGVDEPLFMDAYTLAIERNDGNPLPPQTVKSLTQAAACIANAALNPEWKDKSGSFLVENSLYTETKEYATDEKIAEKLWAVSEKLVGQKFDL